MRCRLCNSEIEEYINHEHGRDDPPTVRFECPCCGVLDQAGNPMKAEAEAECDA